MPGFTVDLDADAYAYWLDEAQTHGTPLGELVAKHLVGVMKSRKGFERAQILHAIRNSNKDLIGVLEYLSSKQWSNDQVEDFIRQQPGVVRLGIREYGNPTKLLKAVLRGDSQ